MRTGRSIQFAFFLAMGACLTLAGCLGLAGCQKEEPKLQGNHTPVNADAVPTPEVSPTPVPPLAPVPPAGTGSTGT